MGILREIRVVDLTRNIAGPFCTMTLGDLGAEVVKIERSETGDDTREWRPPAWAGLSTTFLAFNRNKRSMAIDLDQADGRDIVRRLVERADVLVESFRPGSLAKRGLAYEQVRAINPRLVYCSISGFGARGSDQGRPAYDPVIQAFCGIMSVTGSPEAEPVRTGPAVVDMGAGLWGTLGILAALFERQSTGQGRHIETSLLETGLGWLSYHVAGYLATGVVPQRVGSRGMVAAPYETFQTQDQFLFLAAPNDQLFVRLCKALELGTLGADSRFTTNPQRLAHREALHHLLETRLKTAPAAHWEALLLAQEVPCSRIRTLDQVLGDPRMATLGQLLPLPHPQIPDLRQIDLPVSIDGRRSMRQQAPPALGEHTDEVLRELGFERAQIDRWHQTGVVGGPIPVGA